MIRILIVDEIRLMCDMISSMLSNEAEFSIVGSATSIEEALDQISDANLVLISSTLPDGKALELVKKIRAAYSDKRILVIGVRDKASRILQYIEAGVSGYVLREESVESLLKNIRSVAAGHAIVSPEMAAALIERVAELAGPLSENQLVDPDRAMELTPREREVLQLIGQHMTNQEIADTLYIEVGTVKNHVHNILDKLNVNNRQEAARYLDSL